MIATLTTLLRNEGACSAGIAFAGEVDDIAWNLFADWLKQGKHAGMSYMENHLELRRDPRLLLPGCRSVISAAFNYRQPNPLRGIATYALGLDYHHVLRQRLERVVAKLGADFGGEYRICIDSAPILERYWAEKAGVGVRSPLSGNVTVPGVGSMVFLAEVLTTHEFDAEECGRPLLSSVRDTPLCSCLDNRRICPTDALGAGGVVDARKCINYLTIEHRGEWSDEQKKLMNTPGAESAVFGCDICQNADPANSGEAPDIIPEFKFNEKLETFISTLGNPRNPEAPSRPVKGFSLKKSPLGRAGRKTLLRNLEKH